MVGVHVSPVMGIDDVRLDVAHLTFDGLNELEVAPGIEPLIGKAETRRAATEVVGGTSGVTGLVVLAGAIADGLGGAHDKRTHLITVLEVADDGPAGPENLVIGMSCDDENPAAPMQRAE